MSNVVAELDSNLRAYTDWVCRVEESLRKHIHELETLASNQRMEIERLVDKQGAYNDQVKLKDGNLQERDASLNEAKATISELLEHIAQLEKNENTQKQRIIELEGALAALQAGLVESETSKEKDVLTREEQVVELSLDPVVVHKILAIVYLHTL